MTDLPPILEAGAARLAAMLRAGEVSAVEIMQAHLDRIDAVNDVTDAPITAIVSRRDPDACLAEAAEADAAVAASRRTGEALPLLHGLPLAIKDLTATKGLRTSRGSPLYAEFVPEADAPLAAALKRAGALVVGKTNTPEFGLGSHTLNPVFGPTRNPWDRGRSAGGSSGGAAAALAMRMLPMADGSDMMGSLRNPAGWNNVIGFRPSVGRVPDGKAEGDLYLHQLSTNGPMARSIADLALLLDAMAGFDPAAPLSFGRQGVFVPGLASEAPQDWAKGLKIAWLGDWNGTWPMEAGVLETCEGALKVFEGLGAEVTPFVPDFPWEKIWKSWTDLRSWSVAAANLPDYADEARRAHLKPEAVWEIERGMAMSGLDVHRASAARSDWHRCLEGVFEDFDLVAAPSAQLWPFPVMDRWPDEIAGRKMDTYHRWMECVLPASLSGRPTVCMPAGFGAAGGPGAGLPIGLQLMGRTRGDLEVLRAAAAYETACPHMTARPADPA